MIKYNFVSVYSTSLVILLSVFLHTNIRAVNADLVPDFVVGGTLLVPIRDTQIINKAIHLTSGKYKVYLDLKHTDANCGQLAESVAVFKTNGVVLSPKVVELNTEGADARGIGALTITRSQTVLFRLTNHLDDPTVYMNAYLTVVPASSAYPVSFGFVPTIQNTDISTSTANSGLLSAAQDTFYKVDLTPGSWTISLELDQETGTEPINLQGKIDIMDSLGLNTAPSIVKIDDSGSTSSADKTITVTKPKTVLLRITNLNPDTPIKYVFGIVKN